MKSYFKNSAGFFAIILFALFAGCKKKDGAKADDKRYYFTATFNGEKKDFSHDANFQGGGNNGKWEHIVVGGHETAATDPSKVPPSLDFELWKQGGDIVPGTYNVVEDNLISRYAIQSANGTMLYNTKSGVKNYVLTITEISKNGIKGTFKGTITYQSDKTRFYDIEGAFNFPYETIINSSY